MSWVAQWEMATGQFGRWPVTSPTKREGCAGDARERKTGGRIGQPEDGEFAFCYRPGVRELAKLNAREDQGLRLRLGPQSQESSLLKLEDDV